MVCIRLATLCLLLACTAAGQEFRALLEGTIADPTGAAIPFAQVTVTNAATSVKRFDKTDAAGHYVFQFLAPGSYVLSAAAAGFRTVVQEGITLGANQRVLLD